MLIRRNILVLVSIATMLAACNKDPEWRSITSSAATLDPTLVVRVETRVAVAPSDPRAFTADLPFRAVDTGVGYEVRDFDGTGKRILVITHDATLGYSFGAQFMFTLLPPVGDAPPLQIRARALGAGIDQVLAETAAVAAMFGGDAVTLALSDLRCGATAACSGNDTCCGDQCTDVSRDAKNCGACGQTCGARGDSCSGSLCRCNGASACDAGKSCCGGVGCIDLQTDAFNCGACGKTCDEGEACVAGSCSCGGKACGPNQACCGGVCSDTGCSCGSTTCALSAPICCGSTCTDIAKTDSNCGTCGKTCSAPFACATGSCKCNGTVCSGSDTCCASGCKQLDSDPFNCGACGKACADGETCTGGQCQCGGGMPCARGMICCKGTSGRSCVDPSADKANCGGCGTACSTTDLCVGSACVCPGTTQTCGLAQTCCAGVGCFDLSKASHHCGTCDTVCPLGSTCNAGACVTSTTGCAQSCPGNTVCIGTECTCNGAPADCSKNGAACCPGSTACVDTNTDMNNCGGCEMKCDPSGHICCAGKCQSLDTMNHCGQCGACVLPQSCQVCNNTFMCGLLLPANCTTKSGGPTPPL